MLMQNIHWHEMKSGNPFLIIMEKVEMVRTEFFFVNSI